MKLMSVGLPYVFSLFGFEPIGSRVPSVDVFGSYFPAWLICLLIGVFFAVFVNFAERILQIKPFRFLGPLFPVSVILIVSIAVWFLFFSN
jgi:hypothetical protein